MRRARRWPNRWRFWGDHLARNVEWKSGDLAAYAGKPVRLKFRMKDADLFSIRFPRLSNLTWNPRLRVKS